MVLWYLQRTSKTEGPEEFRCPDYLARVRGYLRDVQMRPLTDIARAKLFAHHPVLVEVCRLQSAVNQELRLGVDWTERRRYGPPSVDDSYVDMLVGIRRFSGRRLEEMSQCGGHLSPSLLRTRKKDAAQTALKLALDEIAIKKIPATVQIT